MHHCAAQYQLQCAKNHNYQHTDEAVSVQTLLELKHGFATALSEVTYDSYCMCVSAGAPNTWQVQVANITQV